MVPLISDNKESGVDKQPSSNSKPEKCKQKTLSHSAAVIAIK